MTLKYATGWMGAMKFIDGWYHIALHVMITQPHYQYHRDHATRLNMPKIFNSLVIEIIVLNKKVAW